MPKKTSCCCSEKKCCCEVVKCLIVTGNETVLGDLTVDGTLTATNLDISGGTLNLCNSNVRLNTISSCTSGGVITVNGILGVCTISSCNGTTITFTDPASFQNGIGSGSALVPLRLTSNLDACGVVISASTITGCSGSPVSFPSGIDTTSLSTPVINMINNGVVNGNVTFTGTVSLLNPLSICSGVSTNLITACGGNLSINSPTVFGSSVSVCQGALSVATISACGSTINFTSPIVGTSVTATNGIVTNTINPLSGTVVTVNGSLTTNGLNTCGGPLTVSQINPCGSGTITVGGNVVITGTVNINNINASTISNPTSVTLNTPNTIIGGDIQVCSGTAFLNTVSPCSGSNTVTFTSPISAPTVITPTLSSGTGTTTVTNNLDVTGTTTSCAGVVTNSLTNCSGAGINVGSNLIIASGKSLETNMISANGAPNITVSSPTAFASNVAICGGSLTVSTINPCVPGNPINFPSGINTTNITSPTGTVNVNGNLNVTGNITGNLPNTFCSSGIIVNSINACPGVSTIPITSPISVSTINGPTSFNGNVNVCSGTLSVATLSGCGTNPITVTSPISFCTSGITTQSISTCVAGDLLINATIAPQAIDLYPGNTTIPLLGNTSLCPNNSTLFMSTITPCTAGGTITVSGTINANGYNLTNVSLGTGASILGALTGPGGNTRNFKSLTSTGGTITITSTANSVNLESTNSGTVTGGANEGTGVGIFDPTTSTPSTLQFKTLTSTNGSIIFTTTATTVNLSTLHNGTVTTGANEGPGTGIFDPATSTATTLEFKTLTSTGGTVTITSTATTVNLESNGSGGTVTGAANEGTGRAVFDPSTSTATTLRFRTLTSNDGSVTITSTGNSLDFSAGTVTGGANEGPGAGIFDPATSTATTLEFKTLTSTGGSINITTTATTVNLESNTSGGTVTGAANEGTGRAVFDPSTSTATTLRFRTLTSNDGSVTITSTGNSLDFSAGTVTGGANEGTGTGIFDPATSTATTLEFKTLTSTGGTVTITSTATTVNLESNGSGGTVTNGLNEGAGFGVFDPTTSTATTLRFRTLTSTGGTVTITNNGTTLDLEAGTVKTATNVGTGTGVFDSADSTASTLAFYSLASPNPNFTIALSGQTINFDYSPINTLGSFAYNSPSPIPPNTWTDFLTPTQTNAVPGYTVSGDSISSIYMNNEIHLLVDINVNSLGGPSLVSAGATYAWVRVVNGGIIRAHYPIPVFADPSQTFPNTGSGTLVRFDFTAYSDNIVNFTLQIWHNGTSNYTGGCVGNVGFYPYGS